MRIGTGVLLPAVVSPVVIACDTPTEPSRQTEALAPVFDVSDQHRAGVFVDLAGGCGLFDGNGDLVLKDADVNVLTQSRNGNALHDGTSRFDDFGDLARGCCQACVLTTNCHSD